VNDVPDPSVPPGVSPPDCSRFRAVWDADYRSCTASALDSRLQAVMTLTFDNIHCASDPIVRLRIEHAAIEALRGMLESF
jgi:hypothetical protein